MIQDDALPCLNFAPALEQIAARHPSMPVCLFLGASPANTAALARRASIRKQTYSPVIVGAFVPLVAVLWPREKALHFLNWSETARGITRADDGNVAKWQRANKQEIVVTVPSLVQHDDGLESVKGGRAHVPWKENWRQALLLAEDALDYAW